MQREGNDKRFSIGRGLALVGLVFVLIAAIGAYLGLASITLIAWWIPLIVSLVLAAISGTVLWRLWQQLNGIDSIAPNFIAHIVFFTFFLTGAFYVINFICRDESNPQKVTAVVLEKYREKHYRSQRVGRNRYVRGNPYYEYCIEVRLENGEDKKISLPFKTYKGVKPDKEITLSLAKGGLGADVLLTSDIPADNPDFYKESKRKGCRFVGSH